MAEMLPSASTVFLQEYMNSLRDWEEENIGNRTQHDVISYERSTNDIKDQETSKKILPTPTPLRDQTNIQEATKVKKKISKENGTLKANTNQANTSPITSTNQSMLLGSLSFGSESEVSLLTNSHQKALRIFNCDRCDKSFRHKSSLKQHCISIHEQSKYMCPVCKKEFNRISSLNTHRSIHDEEKKFKCGHCGKAFHQKGNLKHHIFTHVSIRPYVCLKCGKSFHQPSNLRTHMCLHDIMDPLPLAIILLEGEELAKMNFKIKWNLPSETNNWNCLSEGAANWNKGATYCNSEVNSQAMPVGLDGLSWNNGFSEKYDENQLGMFRSLYPDWPTPGMIQPDIPTSNKKLQISDKPLHTDGAANTNATATLWLKPFSSLRQSMTENQTISGSTMGNTTTFPQQLSQTISRTIKLSSSGLKSKSALSCTQSSIKPSNDQVSYNESLAVFFCYLCKVAFTQKAVGAATCPSCHQDLYTSVVPKIEQTNQEHQKL